MAILSSELGELGWGFIVTDLMNLYMFSLLFIRISSELNTSSNYCISSSIHWLITYHLCSLLFICNKLPSSHFTANALLDSWFQTSVIFLSLHFQSVCLSVSLFVEHCWPRFSWNSPFCWSIVHNQIFSYFLCFYGFLYLVFSKQWHTPKLCS